MAPTSAFTIPRAIKRAVSGRSPAGESAVEAMLIARLEALATA